MCILVGHIHFYRSRFKSIHYII